MKFIETAKGTKVVPCPCKGRLFNILPPWEDE